MTASSGAVGAIVTNRLFFSGSRYTVEEAISLTGAASLVCTLPLALVHFPRHGGMFCGPTTAAGDDHDDDGAVIREASSSSSPAVSLARQHEEDLQTRLQQDMDDLLFQFCCPMASCASSSSCLLPGATASASEEGSSGDHPQLDGGATWGWGSLWNLDDVVDDVDGGFPWLQDQGLAFY